MQAGKVTCRKCERQYSDWCKAGDGLGAVDMKQWLAEQPQWRHVGARVSARMLQTAQRATEITQAAQCVKWKLAVAEVVGQGITGGRLDVKSMVREALDEVVGKEVQGVVLRITAEEWVQTDSSSSGSGSGGGVDGTGGTMQQMVASETAAEQVETIAVAEDEKADEALKAPADLIARVVAGIKKEQQAKAANGSVARVLASLRLKEEEKQDKTGWSGGGGHVFRYILEGVAF